MELTTVTCCYVVRVRCYYYTDSATTLNGLTQTEHSRNNLEHINLIIMVVFLIAIPHG